jgi:hypothetical protein
MVVSTATVVAAATAAPSTAAAMTAASEGRMCATATAVEATTPTAAMEASASPTVSATTVILGVSRCRTGETSRQRQSRRGGQCQFSHGMSPKHAVRPFPLI